MPRPSTFDLRPSTAFRRRQAFTLQELLIVMMILTIMGGMTLSALSGAANMAREQRTRAIIAKLDLLINDRYEGFRTRAVPVSIPPIVYSKDSSGTPYFWNSQYSINLT